MTEHFAFRISPNPNRMPPPIIRHLLTVGALIVHRQWRNRRRHNSRQLLALLLLLLLSIAIAHCRSRRLRRWLCIVAVIVPAVREQIFGSAALLLANGSGFVVTASGSAQMIVLFWCVCW